jgi:hypothetical protein
VNGRRALADRRLPWLRDPGEAFDPTSDFSMIRDNIE